MSARRTLLLPCARRDGDATDVALPSLVALTASACAIGMPPAKVACLRTSDNAPLELADIIREVLQWVRAFEGYHPLLALVSKSWREGVDWAQGWKREEGPRVRFGLTRVLWESAALYKWTRPMVEDGRVELGFEGAYVAAGLSKRDEAVAVLERAWVDCRTLMLDALSQPDRIDFNVHTGAVTIKGIGAAAASAGNLNAMEWVVAKRASLNELFTDDAVRPAADDNGMHLFYAAVYGKNQSCISYAHGRLPRSATSSSYGMGDIPMRVARASASAGDTHAFRTWFDNGDPYGSSPSRWGTDFRPTVDTAEVRDFSRLNFSHRSYDAACVAAAYNGHFDLLMTLLSKVMDMVERLSISGQAGYKRLSPVDYISTLFFMIHRGAASSEHGARSPLGTLPRYASDELIKTLGTLTGLSHAQQQAMSAIDGGEFDTKQLLKLREAAVCAGRVDNANRLLAVARARADYATTYDKHGRTFVWPETLERLARASQVDEAEQLMTAHQPLLTPFYHSVPTEDGFRECLEGWFTGAASTFSAETCKRVDKSSVVEMITRGHASVCQAQSRPPLIPCAWLTAACRSGNTGVLVHAPGWDAPYGQMCTDLDLDECIRLVHSMSFEEAAGKGHVCVFTYLEESHPNVLEHLQTTRGWSLYVRAVEHGRLRLARWFRAHSFEPGDEFKPAIVRGATSWDQVNALRTHLIGILLQKRLHGTLKHVVCDLWNVRSTACKVVAEVAGAHQTRTELLNADGNAVAVLDGRDASRAAAIVDKLLSVRTR
jgi:hypothetical protein